MKIARILIGFLITASCFAQSGPFTPPIFIPGAGGGRGGGGTVTSVSSADANISVATPTTTPVLTLASNLTGVNAATATTLQTARAINGVNFDGSAPITVTAAAGTITGGTLASGVIASSLTSFGSSPSFSGIETHVGAVVETASAMGALAVDVTKFFNTKTVSIDSTITFSGTPATTDTWFGINVLNSDTNPHTITLPGSVFSGELGGLAASAIVPAAAGGANGSLWMTFHYDGTRYYVYGEATGAVSDAAYPTGWSGTTNVAPSKNAVQAIFGSGVNYQLTVYGVGTAYSLTNTSAAVTFGTTSPSKTLDKVGTYLVFAQLQLDYNAATVVTETATIKVRRTNNTPADVSVLPVLDLPVATTLTNTYGIFQIPPFIYTTANATDTLAIFAQVSATLGAGTIDAKATGTSIVALKIF